MEGFAYRLDDLKRLIEMPHSRNSPIIIEGVFLLRLLDAINLKPDYLIYVEKQDHEGSNTWRNDSAVYQEKYRSKFSANFIFRR